MHSKLFISRGQFNKSVGVIYSEVFNIGFKKLHFELCKKHHYCENKVQSCVNFMFYTDLSQRAKKQLKISAFKGIFEREILTEK